MEIDRNCGSCQIFDLKNDQGALVGNTNTKDRGFVRNGVCRGPGGLALGIVDEKTACKQPSGVFILKS